MQPFRPVAGSANPCRAESLHHTRVDRSVDERFGRGRGNTCPGDGQEIESEIRERPRQCVCLGSDQDERPVTTSNFLRSELTS